MDNKIDFIEIEAAFNDFYPTLSFSEDFIEDTLEVFYAYFNERQLIKSMRIACEKTDDADSAIRYFCGICWNRIKNPYPKTLVEKYSSMANKSGKSPDLNKNLH